MRRRTFLGISVAAAIGAIAHRWGSAETMPGGRQFFELRTYRFASAAKQEAFEQFLADAAVPAFNRAGVEPVGIFKRLENEKSGGPAAEAALWVLLPHNSLDSLIALEPKLASDQMFQKAGEAVLRAPKKDPAYLRYESVLLHAMEGAPRIQAPTKAAGRVFELRTYQSHDEERARNKLGMFNAGEFEIFRQANMPGVFFGGAIAGPDLPQLTYMVVHENIQAKDANWRAFFSAADWKKLSADPSYKDNVSKVIDTLLRPAAGSQI